MNACYLHPIFYNQIKWILVTMRILQEPGGILVPSRIGCCCMAHGHGRQHACWQQTDQHCIGSFGWLFVIEPFPKINHFVSQTCDLIEECFDFCGCTTVVDLLNCCLIEISKIVQLLLSWMLIVSMSTIVCWWIDSWCIID
jgi:hypothetical protein